MISVNFNILGNAYFNMGLFERSLEMFHRAIRNEQAHELNGMIPMLYNNLAVLFVNMMDYEKGYEYQLLAIDALDHGDKNSPRYLPNLVIYLSNLVIYMCYVNRIDEIPAVLARLDQLDLSEMTLEARSVYYIGHMYYAFHSGDRETGREYYERALREIPKENTFRRVLLLHDI